MFDNKLYNQLIKFLIVGCSNTIIGYFSYLAFLVIFEYCNLRYDYICASVVSFVISVNWAFVLNKKFVFNAKKLKENAKNELFKAFILYGFSGIVLNNFLLFLFVDTLNFSKYYTPIFILCFTTPFNFIVNKYWVYAKY